MAFEKNPNWQTGVAILEDNVFEEQLIPQGIGISERRATPRFNVRVPLSYRVQSGTGWHKVETNDVSNTGIRIHMEESPAIGTRIDLDVLLPGSEQKVQLEGTVIWKRPTLADETLIECGIAFQNLKKVTGKEKLLKFISDKLCLFALKHSPSNVACFPAASLEDLKMAYRLIYREYQARGYCGENDSEMHFSSYCALPETKTFLLKRQDLLLGTLSLVPDSHFGIPMETVFPEAIEGLRKKGRRIAEVSLLALNQEAFHKKSFSLTDFQKLTGTFHLFKVIFDYARFSAKSTDLVIAVHPKHEDLYSYLHFEKLDSIRSYNSACGKPALPMRLDIQKTETLAGSSSGLIKYFFERPTSQSTLDHSFTWTRSSLHEMLVKHSNIWQDLPQTYRDILKTIYPKLNLS